MNMASIGRAVTFHTGPFAHQTIRTQLEELQKAELGRKCGAKGESICDETVVVDSRGEC